MRFTSAHFGKSAISAKLEKNFRKLNVSLIYYDLIACMGNPSNRNALASMQDSHALNVSGNRLSDFDRPALALAAFMALVSIATFPVPAAAATADSFGQIFCETYIQSGSLLPLMSTIAYVVGFYMVGTGLWGLKDHTVDSRSTPLHLPILKTGIGGALVALPSETKWVVNTLFGTGPTGPASSGCAPGVTSTPGSATDLAQMLTNFVGNIQEPMISLGSGVAYILGVTLLFKALLKGTRYGTDPRLYSMTPILANMAAAAILLAIAQSSDWMRGSVFGAGTAYKSFTGINWTALGVTGPTANVNAAIKSSVIFLQIVGFIGFIRGWLIMKNSVEGTGQATMAQGLTHVIGGIIAMNMQLSLEAAEKTFGVDFVV